MSFIQMQVLIFLSILIFSLIGGKIASLITSLIWLIETFIIYDRSKINYIQFATISISFQIGMILAVARDFILKKIKSNEDI